MADELEKKPGFVLNKKEKHEDVKQEAPVKKKIVIKRKSPSNASPSNASNSKETKKETVRIVSKKTDSSTVNDENQSSSSINTETKVSAKADSQAKTEKKDLDQKNVNKAQVGSGRQNKPFELHSARPNVIAGNLVSGNNNKGRYNGNRNNGSGYNNNGYNNRRDNSSFTGTQAREGYQNRQGGYNRQGNAGGNGQNRQGGFNRQGVFSNNRQNRQGGFNRQGNNGQNRQGGFGVQRSGFVPRGPLQDPATLAGNKGPAKKQFKGKKQVYNKKDKEDFFEEEELYQNKKHEATPAAVVPAKIDIMESISVSDLAKKMNLKANEIIGKLMSMGMMVTINQSIDSDTATILASEYNCEVHIVDLYDETVIESEKGDESGIKVRPPIVTVMGHVDHGKTKTLDAIRNSNVAAGEAGGITQKIGAYQVSTPKGEITFLDTPGHEAFTMMRSRGAQITDIVVLVVAADDGVMPQTKEAIDHAKAADVPIIVAVNKCDKPDANPDRVMTQLSELGLTPEAWGGDTQYVNISALKHEGIDELLDAIQVQAEVLELKAQYDCRAEGKIIESRVDQGRGVVASVVIERGTLRTGDPFVSGIYAGRVRAMFNDKGQKITEAGPSCPVEVLGIENMPNAGDPFQVTESEKEARAFATKRQELKRFEAAKAVKKTTLESLYSDIAENEIKDFRVIIKADLQGSAEALKTSLEKLSTKEIRLNVIHSSAGAINESDVTLAAADKNAIIIGFNVRPTPKAKALADQEKVEIRKYNIIYKCVEEIQQAMEGMLQPDTKEEVTGMLEVRDTFKVPKIGLIAGCYVTDGLVKRTSSVNVIRDGIVIASALKVSSLKRFKDDAKEVKAGFECGLGIQDWQDIKVGDQLEAFEYVEVARKLGKTLAEESAEEEKKKALQADEDKE